MGFSTSGGQEGKFAHFPHSSILLSHFSSMFPHFLLYFVFGEGCLPILEGPELVTPVEHPVFNHESLQIFFFDMFEGGKAQARESPAEKGRLLESTYIRISVVLHVEFCLVGIYWVQVLTK